MEESSLEDFSDEIREALSEIAENMLKTEEFNIRVDPGSKKGMNLLIEIHEIHIDNTLIKKNPGDNFIGIVHRVTISTIDGTQESSIFIKTAPTDEARREMFIVRPCFLRETYSYEVVQYLQSPFFLFSLSVF